MTTFDQTNMPWKWPLPLDPATRAQREERTQTMLRERRHVMFGGFAWWWR